MTSQQLLKYFNNPGLVDTQRVRLLEDLVTRYPYCQSGQILLACTFYANENNQYPNQLKKAAAYAGDRRILRELIMHSKNMQELPSENQHSAVPDPAPVSLSDRQAEWVFHQEPQATIGQVSPTFERMTQQELLAIVKKRLEEIEAEKKWEQINPHAPGLHPQVPVTKTSLIDKFIKDEPRISKPNASFFNPTDSSIRSNFDDEEIVSETLAQLYAQQGNIQKAIHIYEKLSLLNQEKSRFFAAQIEKLNS